MNIANISAYALPIMIITFILAGVFKKINVFDAFIFGANKGIKSLYNILPSLIALVVAVKLLRGSGLIDLLSNFLSPFLSKIGIPSELVPMAILRPISGSGSTALLTDILDIHGPDTTIGLMASVLCCSSETTFYTIAVYYGSCGVKYIRHTIVAALISDVAAVIFSVLFVNLLL